MSFAACKRTWQAQSSMLRKAESSVLPKPVNLVRATRILGNRPPGPASKFPIMKSNQLFVSLCCKLIEIRPPDKTSNL